MSVCGGQALGDKMRKLHTHNRRQLTVGGSQIRHGPALELQRSIPSSCMRLRGTPLLLTLACFDSLPSIKGMLQRLRCDSIKTISTGGWRCFTAVSPSTGASSRIIKRHHECTKGEVALLSNLCNSMHIFILYCFILVNIDLRGNKIWLS